MSVQTVASEEWKEQFQNEEAICFLCGKALAEDEKVIHWMGVHGRQLDKLPFIADNPQDLKVIDVLLKRGMAPALDIFFHVSCVPSFCRRVLQDWERASNATF